jgi:hypothetical protein
MNGIVEPAIQEQVALGERVLWSGRPAQGIMFRSSDLALIPFSLMWGGFAFFWEYQVVSSEGAPFFFMLWGIPFVGIGLYLIAGRFFFDSIQRAHTFYGVTNQRAIIASGIWSRRVTSLQLRTLPDVSVEEKASGRGSISFGSAFLPGWTRGGIAAWPGLQAGPAFELIENPKAVFEIIRKAQSGE